MIKRAAFALCLLWLAQPAAAQVGVPQKKAPPDQRVKAALDQIGYKYELEANNDFKIVPPLDTEQAGTDAYGKPTYRSQQVYVSSNTQRYVSLEIREVWSPAFFSAGPLSSGLANRLLRENDSVKLGAWRVQVEKDTGNYLAVFAVQLAADSDVESLRLAIKSVVLIADRMEKELTGKDDY